MDRMEGAGCFLIGTDRDVGKTMVGAGLVALLNARGRKAALMTPVSTGGSVESAKDLLSAVDVPQIERRLSNPVQLETLAAPYVASKVEDSPIEPEKIVSAFNELRDAGYFVVVEGAGIMVPIRADYFVLDLLVELALPSVVVARSSRGTLNHTLLTLGALEDRDHTPEGVILNGYGRFGEGFAESLNADILEELRPDVPVLANMEWRPEYLEDFKQYVRELGRQDGLARVLERWT